MLETGLILEQINNRLTHKNTKNDITEYLRKCVTNQVH